MSIETLNKIAKIGKDVLDWAKSGWVEDPQDVYQMLIDSLLGEWDFETDAILKLSKDADALAPDLLEGSATSTTDLEKSLWRTASTIRNMIGTISVNVKDVDEMLSRCFDIDDEDEQLECQEEELDGANIDAERVWNVLYGVGTQDSRGTSLSKLVYEFMGSIEGFKKTKSWRL